MPYFDLSLQHVSAPLLRRMKRWGDGDRFLERIDAIRAREPDAAFRSNFIVGYPGETEDDHDQLLDFVEEAQLDWCGFFAFSTEDGTYAADLDGQVPEGLMHERLAELRELQDRITAARRDELIGSRGRSPRGRTGPGPHLPRGPRDRRHRRPSPTTCRSARSSRSAVVDALGPDLVAEALAPAPAGAGRDRPQRPRQRARRRGARGRHAAAGRRPPRVWSRSTAPATALGHRHARQLRHRHPPAGLAAAVRHDQRRAERLAGVGVLLAMLAFTDGIDGWIARRYGTTRSRRLPRPAGRQGARARARCSPSWPSAGSRCGRWRSSPSARSSSASTASTGAAGAWPCRPGKSAKFKTLVQSLAVGAVLMPPLTDITWLADGLLYFGTFLAVLSGVQYVVDGSKAATTMGDRSGLGG